jgi:hypothetical protein
MVRTLWRRLGISPADHHESFKLELPGAREPRGSSRPSPVGEGEEAQIGFLMETKVSSYRMESIKVRTRYKNVFAVDSMGRSGGLALMWSEDVQVEIENYSRRHVNALVKTEINGGTWKLTGFYGHPEVGKRHEAWNLLRYLHTTSPNSWLCIGDFNEITEDAEKFGGRYKT